MQEEVVADEQQSDSQNTDEGSGAQTDDLDSILASIDAEFDDGTRAEPEEEQSDLEALKAEVNAIKAKEIDGAVKEAVTSVQSEISELGVKLPDRTVRALLNEYSNDPRFMKAFLNQNVDSKTWSRTLKATAREIAKEHGDLPDQGITSAREAVATAVRGKSTASEDDAPNFNSMTDQQFNNWKLKNS